MAYRKRVTKWMSDTASLYWRLVTWGIKLTVEMDFPEVDPETQKPYIVISNHQNTLDVLLTIVIVKLMGFTDLRWISKDAMRKVPGIGIAGVESFSAYITREKVKTDTDLEIIGASATVAVYDGASMIIFPEGTRRPKPSKWFANVNDPKVRGFQTLVQHMPQHDVMVIAIDWGLPRAAKRTIWDAADHYGTTLRVKVWVEKNPEVEAVPSFLKVQFKKIDDFISQDA